MNRFLALIRWIAGAMHAVAGVSIVFLMLITLLDVILRAFGKPIFGTYELVGYAGGLAVGLAVPITSWSRGHVYVDTFLLGLPRAGRAIVNILTRLVGAALFAILAWNLVRLGLDLRASGEVSPTLAIRYYPVVFGIAGACVVQALVLLCHIEMIRRGEYE